MENVIGSLWVKVKADLSDFKDAMSNFGSEADRAAKAADPLADTTERTAESFEGAGASADKYGLKLAGLGMQTAGFGKYASILKMSLKGLSGSLGGVRSGLADMSIKFRVARAGGNGLRTSLKAMGPGLKTVSMGFKALGASIAMALLPLIAIMAIIEIAMFLWNRHKEKQEAARKEMEATQTAAKALNTTMGEANKHIKKYGEGWAGIAQSMVAMGQSSQRSIEMADAISESAKKLREEWNGLSEEDSVGMFMESLRGGASELKKWGIYASNAEVTAYALAKGIISEGQALDYTTMQWAKLSMITDTLAGNQKKYGTYGVAVTEDLKEMAKAAEDANKSLGLMSFDALNAVKEDDEEMKNPLEDLFSNIAFSDAHDEMVGITEESKKQRSIWDKMGGLWDGFKQTMGGVWGAITDAGGKAWAVISDVGGKAWSWISDKGGKAWAVISDAGGKAWGWIKDKAGPFLGNAWDSIKNFGGNAWNTIKDVGGKAWGLINDKALPFLGDVWGKIKDLGGKAWDGIKDVGGKAWDFIKTGAVDKLGDIWGDMKKGFKSAIDTISGMFTGMFDGVKNALGGVFDGIKSTLGGIGDKLGGWWGGFKETFGLASGGAVMPGKPGLVTVGDNMKEPEIVAPQSYIADAVADALSRIGGGGAQTQTIVVNLDGVTIAKQIVYPLTQEQRRLGI